MKQLRTVTFNTWNCQGQLEARLALMEAGLQALDGDIILLQEVYSEVPSGLNVADHLAQSLNLNVAFAPARKKIRTYRNDPVLCHSGLAVLSKGNISDQSTRQLPQDERDGERLAQFVSLQMEGNRVLVANTHLSHLSDAGDLRRHELEVLAAHLEDCPPHDMVIVGGDMNADETDDVFNVLAGFQAFPVSTVSDTTLNAVNGASPKPGFIDHLFVAAQDGELEGLATLALDQRVGPLDLFPSDHKAVVLDLPLNPS
ncbi:endonuclease/exonuclease/phosphatase family protein [Magnetovibrio sp. PR-2]|uniref:endonuclease/exonuclease/phosphatase family protein n=1 Tax=Magnetovibrio sp. PR-2 TaxID=3120356 RepID=UPI002FCE5F13